MEQKQISCGPVYDRLPPLSAKYPWLVAQSLKSKEEEEMGDQFFFNIHDPASYYQCRIPELLGKRIHGSFHGWVILSNHDLWSLWNPMTSKIINLPPLMLKDGDPTSIKECCLSLPPNNPNSVLLLTRRDKSTFVFCQLARTLRKLRWTELSYAKQLKRLTSDGELVNNLTCCNGNVYALSSDGFFAIFIMQVDIVVKKTLVVINLSLFGSFPYEPYSQCSGWIHYLKGYNTELYCITLGFREPTKINLGIVFLSRVDMTRINWEDQLEGLKDWDMTNVGRENWEELEEAGTFDVLDKSREIWEEMEDLKDAVFFVDLARDNLVFYSPSISSELGGYIHMRTDMGKIIYSYNLNDKSISVSSMPSPVPPTSHVLLLEHFIFQVKSPRKCRLQGDHYADSKQEEEDKDHGVVSRRMTYEEVEVNEPHLLNLPFHLLEMIMAHCVGLEYLKFRATCKHCHLAAPLIKWKDKQRLQYYSLVSPWLMVVEEDRDIITFEDPVFGDKYFMKSLVSIKDRRIRCSRFGWLLVYSTGGIELLFYNPFTRDIRKLPSMEFYFNTLCFTAPPTSPDCMVVGIAERDEWQVHIHFVARKQSWCRVDLDFDVGDRYSFRSPTFFDQDLYALCNGNELQVFKGLGKRGYSWKQNIAAAPKSCCTSRLQHFLTKCEQNLLLVIVGEFGESVELFKLDDSTKEWKKIDGLGKHVIYIGKATCLCIEAKTPEMENKVYFSRLHEGNKKVVFYSLETGMYHTFNGKNIEENMKDFVGTIHQHIYPHAWIEPNWS